MDTRELIVKQKQSLALTESSLALQKLKIRRADTRRKIELGGLVIKAGMDCYPKHVILGALIHSLSLIDTDGYRDLFTSIGDHAFLGG